MRSGKKFSIGILPTLLCLVVLFVAGCGGSGGSSAVTGTPTAAPQSQQVYKIGFYDTDIATFDPAVETDAPSAQAIQMVFTGLVTLDDKLDIQPQLAKSWDVSSDGLTYTFHLKPNLTFSDGTTLNATDVAYSIDRALSPAVSSLNGVTEVYLGLLKDADARVTGKIPTLINDSIKVVDNDTIALTISKKTAYFLDTLTYPTSYVVEKSVITKWGTKWTDHLNDNGGQGGDGPFKVQSYSHTTGIVFVPNTKYYDVQPKLQRVEFDFYKTVPSSYAAYQANQVDWTNVPAPDTAAAKAKKAEYHQYNSLIIDYIAMNYLYKPFDNIHIREALELAINRDVIDQTIYNGVYRPTCHIVPEGMPGYDSSLTCPEGAPTKGDATKAKALFQEGLQESGYTLATLPPIKLTYQSNATSLENEITTIRQMWTQVLGITVTTQILDFNPLLQQETNTFCTTPTDLAKCANKGLQMWTAAWQADYPDAQDWLTLQFAAGAANNQWNYGQNLSNAASEQQTVQQQLVAADGNLDPASRLAAYNSAEQKLVNDVAWLPTDQRNFSILIKPYVFGVVDNAGGITPPDDWGSIYITAH